MSPFAGFSSCDGPFRPGPFGTWLHDLATPGPSHSLRAIELARSREQGRAFARALLDETHFCICGKSSDSVAAHCAGWRRCSGVSPVWWSENFATASRRGGAAQVAAVSDAHVCLLACARLRALTPRIGNGGAFIVVGAIKLPLRAHCVRMIFLRQQASQKFARTRRGRL